MRFTTELRGIARRSLLVAAIYFALGEAALSAIAIVNPHIAPIWPSAGFAIAMLFMLGRTSWSGIYAGAAAVNISAGASVPIALGIAAGNTMEALLAVALLRWGGSFRPDLENVNDVVSFVLATLLAGLAGAIVGVGALVLGGAPPDQPLQALLHWWLGDWAGALIVGPFVLAYTGASAKWTWTRALEGTSLLALCAGVAGMIFFHLDTRLLGAVSHAPFLLFVFVLWAALRFGVRGTSAVTLLVCLVAVAGTVQGNGVFYARLHSGDSLFVLAMFCVVLAVTGLLAASVTAHRNREHALARDRALLHQILDGLPVGVWTAGRDGMIQSGNRAAARIWGGAVPVGLANYGSLKAWRVMDGKPMDPDDCPMSRAIERHEKTEGEMFEVETFDGKRKTIVVSAWPLREAGHMVGAVTVHQDITELREADRSIQQLYAVVEQTEDIVYVTGRDGVIEYVNPSFVRNTGFAREEAVGRKPSMLKSGQHERAFYRELWSTILDGRPYSAILANRKKNGEIYYESKTISPLRNAAGEITHFVSTGKDVTDAIRAETALRTRALHQQVVAEFGQRALAGGNLAELMYDAVKSVCAALNIRHCKIMMAAPDRKALIIKSGIGIGGAPVEMIRLPANCPAAVAFTNAKPMFIEDYSRRLDLDEPPYAPRGVLRSGLDVIIPSAGGPAGVLAVHAETPDYFTADDQNFVQAIANALGALVEREHADMQLRQMNADLENRVQARTSELAEANRGLEVANRELEAANAELNAFAYSVSHDLRGPLRRLVGFSDLVLKEERGRLADANARRLERIAYNATHMGDLVDDLLHLSRISRHRLVGERFNLTAVARSAVAALRDQQSGRHVRVDVEEGLRACGDISLVRLALSNLLENAWKFTCHAADAHIVVGSITEGDRRVFFVKDNGAGFDMRYADRLFKPFERLHDEKDYHGTGIGLSIVHRVVAKHGGRVWAASQPGHGACFYFTLPEEQHAQQAIAAAPGPTALRA